MTSAPGVCSFTAIATGHWHSLALAGDGTVAAWGRNNGGELGCGKSYPQTPVLTRNLSAVTHVAAGEVHSLAVAGGGTGWGWGKGGGELGNGKLGYFYYPDAVVNIGNLIAVDGGAYHSLALDAAGSVWAFGSENDHGQLGDSTTTPSLVPVAVSNLTGAIAITAGYQHSLAIRGSDGTVWGWGCNIDAELGDGTFQDRLVPVQASGLSGVIAISAGGGHSLALDRNGKVWAWGYNGDGQLGNGTTVGQTRPILVPGLTGITAIAAGAGHSLALKSDRTVLAWGFNAQGELGNGNYTRSLVPVPVKDLTGVVAIASRYFHSLAIKDDGTVWAWGINDFGQLGDGTTSRDSNVPVQVQIDAKPKDQGNVLRAVREGTNVVLTFEAGTAPSWRLFADGGKDLVGTTALVDAAVPTHVDVDAVSRGDVYYDLRGLSMCSASPGP